VDTTLGEDRPDPAQVADWNRLCNMAGAQVQNAWTPRVTVDVPMPPGEPPRYVELYPKPGHACDYGTLLIARQFMSGAATLTLCVVSVQYDIEAWLPMFSALAPPYSYQFAPGSCAWGAASAGDEATIEITGPSFTPEPDDVLGLEFYGNNTVKTPWNTRQGRCMAALQYYGRVVSYAATVMVIRLFVTAAEMIAENAIRTTAGVLTGATAGNVLIRRLSG